MAKVVLSEPAFECLVKHLVEIEEGKNKLLDEFFQGRQKNGMNLKSFLKTISNRLTNSSEKLRSHQKQGINFPL